MFPKNKKLKMPDLANVSLENTTYLGWTDIGTNKRFIVFELDAKVIGIECRYTLLSRDNICSFCNTHGKVALVSSKTKAKKSNNPDYYKAIGNYICFNSTEYNQKIT